MFIFFSKKEHDQINVDRMLKVALADYEHMGTQGINQENYFVYVISEF